VTSRASTVRHIAGKTNEVFIGASP
jgi:hypothetical protein